MSDNYDDTPPLSGWAYIGFAAATAVLGLGLAYPPNDRDLPDWLAAAVLAAAGLLAAIGATAVGVTIAMHRLDWHRSHR